jgi:predicted glycogen debranching enzyme
MGYLKFDKTLMINLEHSLYKEMLRTNKSGAYSYSTIVDCNTRKYNGLLVIPLPDLDNDIHVLLSTLDATVIQHGVEFNLGLHKYPGDNFSPKGHKYIREYDCDSTPRTIYRVGGVILSKEVILVSHESRVLVKYTLLESHSATKLRFKPFLAFRKCHSLCKENSQIDKRYDVVENGIRMCLYPGYPDLFMQFSHKSEFTYAPDWYKNIEYIKEQERGYEFQEDLFVPGYFELPIRTGESIVFSAGIESMSTRSLKNLFDKEVNLRIPRSSFTNCLKNAAFQLYNKHNDHQRYILAGYPWFNYRARDMFVALPGCTISAKDPALFEAIQKTSIKAIRNFMEEKPLDCRITELEAPDVLLWFIWSIQEYAKHSAIQACAEHYGEIVFDILDYLISNKHPNLFLQTDGLVSTNGQNTPASWMNSTLYGKPLVPRSGLIVEINALWYNALLFGRELADNLGLSIKSDKLDELAFKTKISFLNMFLNEHGYLFDYVDGSYRDYSVRPNMVFAVSLNHSPLNRTQKKTVLDFVTKELLTPKGLRSLSPKSSGYNPTFEGNEEQRERAYHNGTAWPWLIGPYIEAYLKVYGNSGIHMAQRIVYNFEEELTDRGIGTISELFDGNPPYRGRGGISFAMSVGEILRAHRLVKQWIENLESTL